MLRFLHDQPSPYHLGSSRLASQLSMDEWTLVDGPAGSGEGSPLATSVLEGDFLNVLRSPVAQLLLKPFARTVGIHAQQNGFLSLAKIGPEYDAKTCSPQDALCVGIAALHSFVQANWTGPDLEQELQQPVKLLRHTLPDAFPSRTIYSDGKEDAALEMALHNASLDELTWAGEPVYHLCQAPFLLVLAVRLFNVLADDLASGPWWRLRVYAVHSRILDTPESPPADVLNALAGVKRVLVEQQAGASNTDAKLRWGRLLARVLVDEGLTLQRTGREKDANDRFLEAANASGLQYEVTGAPGRRTKFQKEDKMILVLLAKSAGQTPEQDASNGSMHDAAESEEAYDAAPSEMRADSKGWKVTASTETQADMPSEMLHNDETLLEKTRFTSNRTATQDQAQATTFSSSDLTDPAALDPMDSCILLGLCLNIHNAAPEHGLTASQMSAFVSRVLAHARNWSVHTMALLLRSRLEADRTRTAQRSALQLQALLDQMPSADSNVAERLSLVHELELPSKWEMQAELARRYAALGVLRSALEIFERVEMWQEVVQCWGALGRQDKGIEVVNDLLQGRKAESDHVISIKKGRTVQLRQQLDDARQAKLWCLLGDLEVDKAQEHYLQAWSVSGRRSARAARSLGGVAFAKGQYPNATLWLRRGLKIQPSYARSWFMLGCVYLRLDTSHAYLEAARCFRRCTALEDEDAESWNNLASCYLRLAQHSEGALREAYLADEADAETDQRAVLTGIEEADTGADSDVESAHSRDSGVAVQSGTDTETEAGDTDTEDARRRVRSQAHSISAIGGGSGQGAFDVKLLAHRALGKALRSAHDDWRVWNNFMIVSVDCGLMNDAVRSLVRVMEIRGGARAAALVDKVSDNSDSSSSLLDALDMPVLNRIVDAVTRAPSSEQDAIVDQRDEGCATILSREGQPTQMKAQHNPHEGHGLWPAVRSLFEDSLLPRISTSAPLWQAYARLLFWRGRFRAALDAHLAAWRASFGADSCDLTDRSNWLQAVEALEELCELLENFGPREVALNGQGVELDVDESKTTTDVAQREPAMANWRFRARSLVRSFIGRTRDAFDTDPEWDRLVELRDSLATTAA